MIIGQYSSLQDEDVFSFLVKTFHFLWKGEQTSIISSHSAVEESKEVVPPPRSHS